MTPRASQATSQRERSEATVRALVAAARESFASAGYADTYLDEVSERAGVTKGAIYHHFSSKQELFRAVFEAEQQRLARLVTEAYIREGDAWKGFYAGCEAFLHALLDPGAQRIAILDAPSVLSFEVLREIEMKHSLALIRGGLERAMAEGVVARRPVEPLAHMLFGALCQSATMVARSDTPKATMKLILAELRALLDSLRSGG